MTRVLPRALLALADRMRRPWPAWSRRHRRKTVAEWLVGLGLLWLAVRVAEYVLVESYVAGTLPYARRPSFPWNEVLVGVGMVVAGLLIIVIRRRRP